jgi:uncharacterized protein (DUF1697 family)
MNTYFALLRGINVSGQKLINMKELQKHLSTLELLNIRTYIQSGNIIFESENESEKELSKKIEARILAAYAFEVPTFIINKTALEKIIFENPFEINTENEFSKPYVIFLEELPSNEQIDKLMALNSENEQFVFNGNVIYIVYKNGAGKSKLTNSFFESKLKIKATTRNWNTVNKLMTL